MKEGITHVSLAREPFRHDDFGRAQIGIRPCDCWESRRSTIVEKRRIEGSPDMALANASYAQGQDLIVRMLLLTELSTEASVVEGCSVMSSPCQAQRSATGECYGQSVHP